MKKYLFLVVAMSAFLSAKAAVTIQTAEGWLESAFVEWAPLGDYTDYNVYVRQDGTDYIALDKPLIRKYEDHYRADALGLPVGSYQLKVVPVKDEAEVAGEATETELLSVRAHDRNGFAHFNWHEGVGAYTDNGNLKSGAQVIYVHKGNAKTIKAKVQVEDPNKKPKTELTGLQAIIAGYEKGRESDPLCIRIIGMLEAGDVDEFGSSAEGIQIKCKEGIPMNITIEGIGNDAVIRGFGFLIRSAKSVEIRNLAIMSCMDDGVSLDTDNSNIWIHHLDVFYGRNKGGDQKKGDGSIDVKSDSKYVTVAYNHLWDTGKSCMCGMKSESGPNYICYHHNWFDHSDSRHPRVRTMSVHVYNNFFDGIAKYCAGATTASSVFVECNYFKNSHNPMLISMQGTDTKNGTDEKNAPTFSKENGGIIKAYNNVFAGSSTTPQYYSASNTVHFDAYLAQTRDEQVPETVTAKQGGSKYNNFDTNSSVMPAITPDDPNNIPEIVTSAYGAGRMFHSDIDFSLANFDPTNYDISNELSNLIVNYTSGLKAILGDEWSSNPDDPGWDPQGVANTTDKSLTFNGTAILNPRGKVVTVYAINGACLGSSSREIIAVDHLPVGTYVAVSKDGAIRFARF